MLTRGLLTHAGSSAEGGKVVATSVLVSAKEEKDLEELLEMYDMGMGDVDDFEQRLQEEYEALEVCELSGCGDVSVAAAV